MKASLFLLLILCFFLSGCTVDTPAITESFPTESTTISSVPETQPSLYDPDSFIEQQTNGAVCAYLLDENCSGIAFMGRQLLLFLNDGYGPTIISRLDMENERVEQSVELSGSVVFESVQMAERSLAYYSSLENCVIVLDNSFRESIRIPMPKEMDGLPFVRKDMMEA